MKIILLMHPVDSALTAVLPLLNQVAQRWGYPAFQAGLLHNLEFCDQFLQLLHPHQGIDSALRTELYVNYIGPGPGGLRAFYWLLQHNQLDPGLIKDYIFCLQCALARSGALNHDEFQPMLQWLLEYWRGQNPLLVLNCLCRLLNSHAVSSQARCLGLKQALSPEGLAPEWHTRLAHWACHSNHNDPDLPTANPELHRTGLLECIRLGEAPQQVLERAFWQWQQPETTINGLTLLDILHKFTQEIDPQRGLEILISLSLTPTSSVRRRAFQMLEESQGQEWLHLGLRNNDASVRAWAIRKFQQKKMQIA